MGANPAQALGLICVLSAGLLIATPTMGIALSGHEPAASAVLGCAPYDGRAVDLTFELSATCFIRTSIWGAGLAQMKAGQARFALEGYPSSSGTGHALLCPKSRDPALQEELPCRPVAARFEFDVCGTQAGDKLRGRFYYREAAGTEKVVPFSVQLMRPKGGGPYCP